MASKPSLSAYIGGTAFLLMLATLAAAVVGQAVESAVVTAGGFVVLVSAVHVTAVTARKPTSLLVGGSAYAL